ncbi:MAG: hypothetical protein ACO1HP_09580 [Bacteroidota bacterium]
MLTTAQKDTIAADLFAKRDQVIIGNKTVTVFMNESRYDRICDYYNKKNEANTKIWKPVVSRDEIINAINFTEFVALTAAKRDAARAFLLCTNFDLTISRVRDNVTEIFGNGTDSTTKIFAKCDKVATNLELLFATNSVSSVYGYEIAESEMRMVFTKLKQLIKAV